MAEVENTPETPRESAGSPVEAPEVESVPEIDSTPPTGTEGPSLDDLRAEVEQASSALRTSEDLRQQLNTQLDDAEARVKAAEVALERERAARRHGLPDELMPFLRGETAEELATEAATLAKYADARTSGLGMGGLDPNDSNSGGIVGRIIRKSREL
ncbi:hypothetical protein [Streptomyces sp. ISL-100]|uniref:hypothetical protein n=1 Tax=Streptomyces sp. ISL-100 TaxID=2819173 RepID=UPI001BEBA386|nr:hypothetical protein [Streptomyces sp. ISL-100]MBT2400268.1 hypothetical protein [Streptomyces sp. ISL-100]